MNSSHYDPEYVRNLFNEMAQTYGIVNLISSFGFSAIWRKQCLRLITIEPNQVVYDLMTGMGELCPDLSKKLRGNGSVTALDLSAAMCARARQTAFRLQTKVKVVEADVLNNNLQSSSADAIVSTFGLKTFSAAQIMELAREVSRLLKHGGQFAFLEISVPKNKFLRVPYMFYIKHVIPLIGRMLMGNPENYRMLGNYTEAFVGCGDMLKACQNAGLSAQQVSHFGGCATTVYGSKLSV